MFTVRLTGDKVAMLINDYIKRHISDQCTACAIKFRRSSRRDSINWVEVNVLEPNEVIIEPPVRAREGDISAVSDDGS